MHHITQEQNEFIERTSNSFCFFVLTLGYGFDSTYKKRRNSRNSEKSVFLSPAFFHLIRTCLHFFKNGLNRENVFTPNTTVYTCRTHHAITIVIVQGESNAVTHCQSSIDSHFKSRSTASFQHQRLHSVDNNNIRTCE